MRVLKTTTTTKTIYKPKHKCNFKSIKISWYAMTGQSWRGSIYWEIDTHYRQITVDKCTNRPNDRRSSNETKKKITETETISEHFRKNNQLVIRLGCEITIYAASYFYDKLNQIQSCVEIVAEREREK